MSSLETCSKCGNYKFAVARDMIGTRHCDCGHTWVPESEKPKEPPKPTYEQLEIGLANYQGLFIYWKEIAIQLERQIPRLEATNALYYKTMGKLSKRNEELESAIGALANEVQELRGSNG